MGLRRAYKVAPYTMFMYGPQIALRVMRQEKDVLMSVLRPFVFDPLLDWTRGSKGGAQEGSEHLSRVESRLLGNVEEPLKKKNQRKNTLSHHPLSVEGQVKHVIQEAMDHENLAQMYWGWAPYL